MLQPWRTGKGRAIQNSRIHLQPLVSHPVSSISGTARVPGDKSISHRALLLGALSVGETVIDGLLEGEDVLCTARALRAMGVEAAPGDDGAWHVRGVGIGGLREPACVLDMGNSGTAARLLLGVLASHPLTAFLTGDHSLCGRPMSRVQIPLEQIGAKFTTREGGRMPLSITGTGDAIPVSYRLPVASAQVKSAVLLAGLNTPGRTSVIEPRPTRDHTERMLSHFGAEIDIAEEADGARVISLAGQPELAARHIAVPADISSAAFPLVAALIAPDADLVLPGVGVNPTRRGLIDTLIEMGADIALENPHDVAGEPVADLHVKASALTGVEVPAARAPSMIDEYPILAVAAAIAGGTTIMHGLGELRVKESDRLAAMARGLSDCGIHVEQGADSLVVHGSGGGAPGGGNVVTELDHRIAMSFLVLGMAAEQPVSIDDCAPIDTSFPGFVELMGGLGADLRAGGNRA
jgi:3-phosphoshikimate 1-carboxyvinyltransferase